jgi:peptidoglycan/LPS O-acetylase OafA/YrhL
LISSNKIWDSRVARVIVAVIVILLIPLVAMQFSTQVNWNLSDFVITGILLFCSGFILDVILTKVRSKKQRLISVLLLLVAFLYLWAELAVGIFTNLGS